MSFQAWVSLGVLALLLAGLLKDLAADALFLGATVILTAIGVITPSEAFVGFSNEAVLTVAALFVVAAGLRETGVMDYFGDRFLGKAETDFQAMVRLAVLLIPLSALLNNTPIVAMLLPIVIGWSRKRRVSPSRLLIPLSYLTILGGICTLIGTSTNLVVQGLMVKAGMKPMSLMEVGYVGIPCALIGAIYLLTLGRRLLPDRKELIEQLGESRREYLVEMLVQPGCRLIGQSVGAAGLRHLPGLFLIEIDRDGKVIGPVEPTEIVAANDRLIFTGVVGTIVDLEKIPGLIPAADSAYEVSPLKRRGRQLCEAVISATSPLNGKAIRDADFRALYDAAVVAVHRDGARLTNKVGDIVLRPGDTLLLQTGDYFSRSYRNNPDFYLVGDVEDSRPVRRDRAGIAIAVFVGLVLLMAGGYSVTISAFLAAGVLVGTRCISAADARKSVEWQVLVAIAASFGIGAALQKSGAASAIAGVLVDLTKSLGPRAALAAIYLGTMILTEMISNNAAAALAFPFGLATAASLGVDARPFAMAVTLAASSAFSTPIGYQTHMMVYGPGGYRFFDFVKVGLPMNIIVFMISVILIPFWWPF